MHLISKLHEMKRLLFLFLFIIPAARDACSQTITLSVEKMPLEKVFFQIEKQTDYNFIYSTEALAQSRPVTLQVKNEKLESVLVKCFANQDLSYVIENRHIVVRQHTSKNQGPIIDREIRGRVTNETGEPIPGISISLKGGGGLTSTDANGEFIVNGLNENSVIIFSGAEIEKQEVYVGKLNFIHVTAKSRISTLDETLVIAYGKTTRREATGTVSKISGEDIRKQPVSNPLAGLAGRIAGLQINQGNGMPGSFFNVRLRGQNSIANGNDPLFIIDGIPYPSFSLSGPIGGGGGAANSALNNIDPSDIQSIEVLKDAEATAIYGSRGANGVILITTRKGAVGKTRVELNAYTGWGWVGRTMDLMNTKQYLEMRREAFANDGTVPTATTARDLLVWDTTNYTDWQKELMGETMRITDIKANVSGGSAQTQFLAGGGYHKETTVMPGNFGEEKSSMHFNINHESEDKKWKLSFYGSYLINRNVLPHQDPAINITLSPNTPAIYDSSGKLNWANSTWTNPMAGFLRIFKTNSSTLIGNTTIGFKPLTNLELKLSLGYNDIMQDDHFRLPMSSNDPALLLTGTAAFGNNKIRTIIAEPQANYNKRIRDMSFALVTGLTIQSTRQNAIYIGATGYQSDELLGSIRGAAAVNVSSETDSRYRYIGGFGRFNFDYAKKYFLTITARRDGSSRYGPANRFANFGSAGIAWVFSKEKFMEPSSFISFGKIKATTGVTGNDQIGDYKYLDTYSTNLYPYLGTPTYQPTQLANPEYNWERVRKVELGLELGILQDRLVIAANYYHNSTTNQLILYALPATTGFSGVLKNLPAKIVNKGFEFELTANLLNKQDLKWSTSMNLSIPQNKLVSFDGIETSTYANTYLVGKSLFIARRYTYTGLDPATGNYLFNDVNADNKITIPQDLDAAVFIGTQYFGGFQNNLRYKKIELTVFLQFSRMKHANSYLTRFGRPGTLGNQPAFLTDRWRKPGDLAEFQKYSNTNSLSGTAYSNYRQSDAAFSDASFIRLKNIDLSWNVYSRKSRQKWPIDITVFAQGRNIITITRYRGLDPETKSLLPPATLITTGFRITL